MPSTDRRVSERHEQCRVVVELAKADTWRDDDPDASLDGLDADDVARLRSAMVEIGDDDAEVSRTLTRTPPDAPPPKKHRYSMSPAALDLPRPDTLRSGSEYSFDPLPQAGSTSPLWAFPEEELPAE